MRGRWWVFCGITLAHGAADAAIAPECKAALSRGKAALAKRAFAEAASEADLALQAAGDPPEGGECSAAALRLAGDAELGLERFAAAAKRYRAAAHRAVADDRSWRALTDLRVRALGKAGRTQAAERVKKLLGHAQATSARARGPWVAKPELAAAERALDEAAIAFRTDRDRVRAGWAVAVKAKLLAWSGEPARAIELASAWLAPDRPALVRQIALEASLKAAQSQKDLQAEVRFALLIDAAKNAALPPAERPYARSAAVERACTRWEASAGPGRCAVLAKEITGEFSFRDFSRARPRPSRSADEVEAAQSQYLPAVRGCLEEAVKARPDDTLFDGASIKIEWVINPQGRTADVEISPRRYDAVLGPCVRERVALFRYPRTLDGAVHTVSIPYQLETIERLRDRGAER